MRDHQKSTCLSPDPWEPTWEKSPAIREPMLLHLPPDVAESVRALGRVVYELLDHLGLYQPPGSWTAARLGATVAELRFLRQYLETLSEARFACGLEEADARLAERAEGWAVTLDELAAEIEAALPAEAPVED